MAEPPRLEQPDEARIPLQTAPGEEAVAEASASSAAEQESSASSAASDRGSGLASAAVVLGPAFVVAAGVSVFLPLGRLEIFLAFALLALAPAVLSLAWLPGGSRSRARSATALTALILGLEFGWLGSRANPCTADPTTVGVTSVLLAVGTLLVAVAIGRSLAINGHAIAAVLIAGVLALVGFLVTAFQILPLVFVLC